MTHGPGGGVPGDPNGELHLGRKSAPGAPGSARAPDQQDVPTWQVYAWFAGALTLSVLGGGIVFSTLSSRVNAVTLVTVSITLTAATLLGCALIARMQSLGPPTDRLRLCGTSPSVTTWLVCLCGAPALGMFLDSAVALLDIERAGTLAVLFDTIARANASELVLFTCAVSLGPGLGEELLFRGYMQPRLIERHGAVAGILVASGLFGLIHMDPLHSPLAFTMGIYLGYVAWRFDVRLSIAVHMFNNLFSTLAVVWSTHSEVQSEAAAVSCALGLALFLACLWYLVRGPGRRAGRHP